MSTRLDYIKQTPQLFHAMMALEKQLAESTLPKPLTDLIKIRASQLNGCLFCLDMHTKEARLHGERELRVHHLPAWRESSLFTEQEKAALDWTEQLTRINVHGVEDSDYARVSPHFNEKEMAELTFAIVTINAWNRLGVAFRPTAGGMDKMMGLEKAGLS